MTAILPPQATQANAGGVDLDHHIRLDISDAFVEAAALVQGEGGREGKWGKGIRQGKEVVRKNGKSA